MATPAISGVIHRLRAAALKQGGVGVPDGELLDWFIAEREEAAFEALVRRHGPMVFGVCRRILRNDADAEDAFQATFLVLVRKAASIRPRGMVSNWLYGVAHNTALKAKAMNHQRQRKEKEAGKMPKGGQATEVWEQVQSLVDTELSRLPDKYRVPIVLCDLEGKTIKEAVHHLGWPQGTVASRLTRGRVLLARRLSKHGVLLSTGLLAGVLAQGAATASVPAALTATTISAGCLVVAGKTAAASGASATALALADGVLKTMLLVKLKMATAVVLAVAMLTAGAGALSYCWLADDGSAETQSLVVSPAPTGGDASAVEPAPSACKLATPEAAPAPSPNASGDVTVTARIYVIRRQELKPRVSSEKPLPDLYALDEGDSFQMHTIAVRVSPAGKIVELVRPTSADPHKQASTAHCHVAPIAPTSARPASQQKSPDRVIALIREWPSDKLTVILDKGKLYLIRPGGKDARPVGADSLRLLPDGARLFWIGLLHEDRLRVTFRWQEGEAGLIESGPSKPVILPANPATSVPRGTPGTRG